MTEEDKKIQDEINVVYKAYYTGAWGNFYDHMKHICINSHSGDRVGVQNINHDLRALGIGRKKAKRYSYYIAGYLASKEVKRE